MFVLKKTESSIASSKVKLGGLFEISMAVFIVTKTDFALIMEIVKIPNRQFLRICILIIDRVITLIWINMDYLNEPNNLS